MWFSSKNPQNHRNPWISVVSVVFSDQNPWTSIQIHGFWEKMMFPPWILILEWKVIVGFTSFKHIYTDQNLWIFTRIHGFSPKSLIHGFQRFSRSFDVVLLKVESEMWFSSKNPQNHRNPWISVISVVFQIKIHGFSPKSTDLRFSSGFCDFSLKSIQKSADFAEMCGFHGFYKHEV